jgi:hypothetical protein
MALAFGLLSGGSMLAGTGPGEVPQLLVTAHDPVAGTMTLSYGAGCMHTGATLHYGRIDDVWAYGYSGQVCNVGMSGEYAWSYPMSQDSLFFLLAGNDGQHEGSYGTDSSGVERCADAAGTLCPMPQDLTDRCDSGPLATACSLVYRDDFESGAPGWSHAPRGGLDTWHLSANLCWGDPLGSTMWLNNSNSGPECYSSDSIEGSQLLSPPITLPGASGSVLTLGFDAWAVDEDGICTSDPDWYDVKDVGITTDGGTTYTILNDCFALTEDNVPTHREFDVTAFAGQIVQVIFVYENRDEVSGYFFAVDNVTIRSASP